MKSKTATIMLGIALIISVSFNLYFLRNLSNNNYENGNEFASTVQSDKQAENTDVTAIPSPEELEELEAEVIRLTNEYRVSLGLNELTQDNVLKYVARIRAQEIVTTWSHVRYDGTSYVHILDEIQYPSPLVGENLAKGQETAAKAIEMWKESPSHNDNLIESNFNKIGVGVHVSEDGHLYYVQIFAQ